MNRRITAWMALLAMLSGLGLPLHAYAQHSRAGGPGSDFCTAGKAGRAMPALPDRAHATACDMCCGCVSDGAAAAPATHAAMVAATFIAVTRVDLSLRSAALAVAALPRGPPRST